MGDVDPGLMEAHHGFIADGLEQLLERHGDRVYRLALRITVSRKTPPGPSRTRSGRLRRSGESRWLNPGFSGRPPRRRTRRCAGVAPQSRTSPWTTFCRCSTARDVTSSPVDDWSGRIHEGGLQGALRTILAEAIDALPADYKTALILHDVERASKPDIAEVLGIDVPGVNARVHRARLFLRKRLSEYFESAA
jgi:Sigma-70, region 4